MKKYFFIFFCVQLASVSYGKTIKVVKAKQKRTVNSESFNLAKQNFLNFVACQRHIKDQFNQKDLVGCMGQFLHSSVPDSRKLQFVQFFQLAMQISEPYSCAPEALEIPRLLNESYDVILCFDSIGEKETARGLLLFKNEKEIPKLILIKI